MDEVLIFSFYFYFRTEDPTPSTANEENSPVDQEEEASKDIREENVQRNRKLTLSPTSG